MGGAFARLATSGGIEIPDEDWLTPLPDGTRFLCLYSSSRSILDEYTILNRSGRAILLETVTDGEVWVAPVEFCMENTLFEILDQEQENGNCV